jgi:hypothetical protein
MSKGEKAKEVTLLDVVSLMKPAYEKSYDCQIDLYSSPSPNAVMIIGFFGSRPLDGHVITAEVFADGSYNLKEPVWKATDIHPLAYAARNAEILLILLSSLKLMKTKKT